MDTPELLTPKMPLSKRNCTYEYSCLASVQCLTDGVGDLALRFRNSSWDSFRVPQHTSVWISWPAIPAASSSENRHGIQLVVHHDIRHEAQWGSGSGRMAVAQAWAGHVLRFRHDRSFFAVAAAVAPVVPVLLTESCTSVWEPNLKRRRDFDQGNVPPIAALKCSCRKINF